MNRTIIMALVLLFNICKADEKTTNNETILQYKNEIYNSTINIAQQDSLKQKNENIISLFEAKRDKTIVEINRIKQEIIDDINEEHAESLKMLNEKQKELNKKIEDFKKVSKVTLKEMKIDIDSAIVNLERDIKQVKSKIIKK